LQNSDWPVTGANLQGKHKKMLEIELQEWRNGAKICQNTQGVSPPRIEY